MILNSLGDPSVSTVQTMVHACRQNSDIHKIKIKEKVKLERERCDKVQMAKQEGEGQVPSVCLHRFVLEKNMQKVVSILSDIKR